MVYVVELGERSAHCSSAHCVAALVKLGWRLSNPAQLGMLVQELATAAPCRTHEPSDHLH
jgi:hypothetical protein